MILFHFELFGLALTGLRTPGGPDRPTLWREDSSTIFSWGRLEVIAEKA